MAGLQVGVGAQAVLAGLDGVMSHGSGTHELLGASLVHRGKRDRAHEAVVSKGDGSRQSGRGPSVPEDAHPCP